MFRLAERSEAVTGGDLKDRRGEIVDRGLDRIFRCCTQGPGFPSARVKDIWEDRIPQSSDSTLESQYIGLSYYAFFRTQTTGDEYSKEDFFIQPWSRRFWTYNLQFPCIGVLEFNCSISKCRLSDLSSISDLGYSLHLHHRERRHQIGHIAFV